jgi:diaminohydroxyphosphoribosylaminopyrimidine deaminase/5-amino-6-(5-phosphoribosylamino)uracil reductase
LKTDRLDQAIRLERVKHQVLGDDQLVRGFITYPAEMNFDEYLLGIR